MKYVRIPTKLPFIKILPRFLSCYNWNFIYVAHTFDTTHQYSVHWIYIWKILVTCTQIITHWEWHCGAITFPWQHKRYSSEENEIWLHAMYFISEKLQ